MSAGLLWGSTGTADARPKITGVRLGTHKTITRFVLTVDQPIRYRVFVLSNPYRVVVDMPAVDWRLARDFKLRTGGPVAAFRFGAFTVDTTRVVLDVKRPIKVQRSFPVPPGGKIKHWRLVVDLQAISKAEFARLRRERLERAAPPKQKKSEPVTKPARPRGAKPVIVLDSGHGGVDFGAIGLRGTPEKTVVLKFARQLRAKLERTGRYKVLLTRERDYFIPLRKRYEIARRVGAELFISIHADAHPIRRTRGLSVYTLSERA
ncbi:MAG: N-acetylmuramoyl-L-alanine amidase, partial [Pseudomonadota bacterium]